MSDDEKRPRSGIVGANWELPPEQSSKDEIREIEASGKNFAAPAPKHSGYDRAIENPNAEQEAEAGPLPESIGGLPVRDRLGAGGMAEVFLAEDNGRPVVVKRMLPHLARDAQHVAMFLRESEVAKGIAHPNIVRLFGSGMDEGVHFHVIEYVDGLTLHRLAKRAWRGRRPIPQELIFAGIADAAWGLDHLHHLEGPDGPVHLIHRDISPDNLIMDRGGITRVFDFGIAKSNESLNMTGTGQVKGKIPYMPPEQLQGGQLDARADIYSLGITFYWLLCGTRPFRGESEVRLMQAILMEHPAPPSALNPTVPPEVDSLVLDMLAKDPEQRPHRASEVRRRLQPFLSGDRTSIAAFLAEMKDAPPSADSNPETSSPFAISSPTTNKRSETFSVRVAELVDEAQSSTALRPSPGPDATPWTASAPTNATPQSGVAKVPAPTDDFDDDELRRELVGPSSGKMLAIGAAVVVGVGVLIALLIFLTQG
jgi:serine/threonine-protein kinase